MKYKTTTVCLFLLGLGLATQAQESAVTSGGDFTGDGGNTAYSIGQTVYTVHTGIAGSLTNGVQQPYEISVVTGVDHEDIALNMIAYPNPTVGDLTLEVGGTDVSALAYQLYDMSGKLVAGKNISGTSETIAMKNLAASTYFLKVSNGTEVIKTFKISKTK